MKASDYMVKFLVDHGTDTAFVFTGGAIAHIIDSMRNYKETNHVFQQFHMLP